MRWLLGLALLLAACTSPEGPGRVEGTVEWEGRGVPAALVQAYARPDLDPSVPPVAEGPTDEEGRFRLELPPGTYWVWARATVDRPGRQVRLRGQAEPAPVSVAAGRTATAHVALSDPSGFGSSAPAGGVSVEGEVRGAPPAEVMVYAYPGRPERPTGPGFAAAATPDAEGRYRLVLAPGPYTLAARWRQTGESHGALEPGDRVAETAVEVKPPGPVAVPPLELRPLDPAVWGQTLRATPAADTWAEGTVTDAAGRPVAGLHVLAFTDPRMVGKPAALSAPTDPAGRFRVYLPGPGRYWFGARSRLGGPAEPGEKVGAFRGEDGTGVEVAEGQHRQGIRIEVEEMW